MLKERGIDLIAGDSPDAFLDDTPTAVLIRQVLGSVSQFEKAMLVSKLRGARDRKKAETGKCGGRKGALLGLGHRRDGGVMRLTFCVASGATDDLQHHHLVTRAEGGRRGPSK